MKKKLLSLLLALCLVMALVPMTAFAADTMDIWDGTADTSWYDENKTEFHLQTAEQLAGMAKLVNDNTANFKDKTVYLDNDLDLGGHEWISIGNGANTAWGSFQGIFDGQSHVVYNLYSHEGLKSENKDNNNNLYRNGLFGAIYNATVQNLGIENADIVIPMNDTSTYGKGILVDWMTDSTIKNCYTTGSITGGSYIEKFIGGIAGFLNGNNSISQCYSTAAITGNYDGEYYAEQEGGLEPMDCWDSLGGIVGASYTGQVTISDCWFGGEIVVNSIQAPVGGIIGFGQGVSMVNCLVATKGIGNDGLGNTCWLGYVVNTDAKNCFWPADDRYGSNVSNEQSGNSAGTATNDFNSDDVLVGLQANAGSDVEWVSGIGHPTFVWDANNIPADYTAVDAAIGKVNALNKDEYKDFTAVEAAVNAVVRDKNITEQSEVDAMVKAIEDAIAALQYKDADYTKVDAAIAKANALKKDDYKDFSAVETAVNAVVRDKNITEQSEVDAMAKAIENAIAALQYKDADYTRVDAAIAKANALRKDNYKDFTGVEAAVNAVTRGKNITQQAEVDAMAKAIEDALAALQYKDADYTRVDAAIARANALNKNDYKDFSGVECAIRAVARGKNITQQAEVDAMAKAIEDALAALQYKDANKTTQPTPAPAATATPQYTIPQTGDTSNPALLVVLMLVSGSAAIGTAVVASKRKNNR
ncbi:MAG: LPXTG cell wall anchor domain-containing protein [Gemmiger sp.]|nr:LPXTG cell wall anchor domain-containing protein [Gemmiger sp.]